MKLIGHYERIIIWIAAREATPNNPKKPEITAVNKLMGICNPNEPPITLKKNKNKIPIPSLTTPLTRKRIGLNDDPTKSNNTITATMIEITIVEFNRHQLPLTCPL